MFIVLQIITVIFVAGVLTIYLGGQDALDASGAINNVKEQTAELVTTRREGTQIFYKLEGSHVADVVVQAFSHAQHERRGLPDHPKGNR